jgi:hypothetical protein
MVLWVDYPISGRLRETFQPINVTKLEEYRNPDEDEASNEAHLHKSHRNKRSMPHGPPSQMALLLSSLPVQVLYLTWWFTKFFEDQLNIF